MDVGVAQRRERDGEMMIETMNLLGVSVLTMVGLLGMLALRQSGDAGQREAVRVRVQPREQRRR